MTDVQLLAFAYAYFALFPKQFTDDFDDWIADNLDFYRTFEAEALAAAKMGKTHYSARTIVEYIRHWTAMRQVGAGGHKANNDKTPDLARLFTYVNPAYADLFEFRKGTRL